jgi:hypothetical protein
MGPDRHVVIASIAPLRPRQLAMVAGELGVEVARLVPAIAAELRIRYQLERVYHIRRTARFLRARGKTIPTFPTFQVLAAQPDPDFDLSAPSLPISTREMEVYRPPGTAVDEAAGAAADGAPDAAPGPRARPDTVPDPEAPGEAADPGEAGDPDDSELIPVEIDVAGVPGAEDLDDLSHHAVLDGEAAAPAEPIEDEISARQRRTYVRTLADAPSDSEPQPLGRIAIRKVAVGSAPRIMAGATLGEATRAIRRSTGRDRVADLVIDTLDRFAPACDAAILLVIRGAAAIGWKGFQRAGAGLGEIAVPMEQGGLVPRAIELNVTLRRGTTELDAIDQLLLASLGKADGDLVVVPISIADQVMCAMAIATPPDAPIACAEPIAAAAGAAFARLMRDASR